MFERSDWEVFRSIDGLCQKAGIPRGKLGALVPKELIDNALDACDGSCAIDLGRCGQNGFYVQDNGPGLDPDQVAELFSFNRPLRSSKFLRLPSRGALGNGLRVVSGAIGYALRSDTGEDGA